MRGRLLGLEIAAVATLAALLASCGTIANAQGVRRVRGPILVGVRPPRAQPVPPVMRRALQAARNLRFSGTRVVEFRTGPDAGRHVEFILKDGPRSRVWFPDDSPYAGQIIIEKGRQRMHYFPKTGVIQRSAARGEDAYNRLVEMIRNRQYGVSVASGGTIAGLATRVATVTDESGKPTQRLWIDPSSGMVLRRDLYDVSGATVGFFEYSNVNFNPVIGAGDFNVPNANVRYTKLRDRIGAISGRTGLLPYALVQGQGYELMSVHVLQPKSAQPMLVETYKGTQGSVSLFQTRGPINARRLEKLAAGRYQTYTWRQNGSSFALVGDLGASELQRLAGQVAAD